MSSRRRFLKAAGGAALLPFLPSLDRGRWRLGPSAARAATPKRLVFMYAPNGVPPATWWPLSAPGAALQLGPAQAALAPWSDRVTVVRGLSFAARGPGGPHARGVGTALTGTQLQPGDMPSNDGTLAGWANGPSLDQVLAARLSPGTMFPTLQVGVRCDHHRSTNMSRLSYGAAGRPIPPVSDPATLWQTLFPEVVEDRAGAGFQGLVLDAVKQQIELVKGAVSAEDRRTLEAHMSHVDAIQTRLAAMGGGGGCESPAPPVVEDVNGDGSPNPDHDATMERVAELQMDMLVLALACDRTRIATYQFGNAWARMTYPWIDSPRTNHDLSHAGDNQVAEQAAWTAVTSYHMGMLARLIRGLQAVPDGDGTLFDSTAIVWFTEVAVGNTHSHRNMPYLVAGDLGGALRSGQYIDVGDRFHNDLLVTLMNAMGVQENRFGDADLCTGPIEALLS